MGLLEKKRCSDFYMYCQDIDFNNPKTWKDIDITKQPMRDVFKKYKLEDNTIDFLGHAVSLQTTTSTSSSPQLRQLKRCSSTWTHWASTVTHPSCTQFMAWEVSLSLSVGSVPSTVELIC